MSSYSHFYYDKLFLYCKTSISYTKCSSDYPVGERVYVEIQL